jgi:hypothetical protein
VIILERHQGVPWCYVQLDRIVTRPLFIPSYLGAAGLSIFFSCPVGADGDDLPIAPSVFALVAMPSHVERVPPRGTAFPCAEQRGHPPPCLGRFRAPSQDGGRSASHRPLADQTRPHPMEHEHTLLLGALDGHEPRSSRKDAGARTPRRKLGSGRPSHRCSAWMRTARPPDKRSKGCSAVGSLMACLWSLLARTITTTRAPLSRLDRGRPIDPAPCKVWGRPVRGCDDILPSLRTAPPLSYGRGGAVRGSPLSAPARQIGG